MPYYHQSDLPYWLGSRRAPEIPRQAPHTCSRCQITFYYDPAYGMCRECHTARQVMDLHPAGLPPAPRRRPVKAKPKPKRAPVKKPTKTPKVKPKPTSWDKILNDSVLT